MASKLTPRQAAFVQEYLVDLNATQAAIRAGYSEKTAGRTGHENLKKPEIAAALEKAMAERSETTRVTAQDVLERLRTEAEGLGPDTNSAARIKAAELLGKHLGMFTDKVETSGTQRIEVVYVDDAPDTH